jgi:hypothetical protein
MGRRGLYGSGSDTAQAGNKVSLSDRVSFRQPPEGSLVDPVHLFVSLQGPPRALTGAVTFAQPNPLFHGSVILPDEVVQMFALSEPRQAGQRSVGFSAPRLPGNSPFRSIA